jgi:CheY-like chemotaxis protein
VQPKISKFIEAFNLASVILGRYEKQVAKILIVDDERDLLWLLDEVLKEHGHTIFIAVNGQEALRIIEREQPHLVITDVMMPVMDGYALLECIRIHPKWQAIKVVIVSAAKMQRSGRYQAEAYISKPYDLDEVEAVVERLLAVKLS